MFLNKIGAWLHSESYKKKMKITFQFVWKMLVPRTFNSTAVRSVFDATLALKVNNMKNSIN